jgi:uncharacterized OsmC-like protein
MTAPPTRYEVEARIVGPGVSEAACRASRIAFDSSPGQSPDLPGPAELLASAFAACLLKNVERFSEMLPFRHAGASVRVTTEREAHPPRFARIRYELRVVTDEEPRRVELLYTNLRKYGTVYNTLAATCDVSGELIAAPAPAIHAGGERA